MFDAVQRVIEPGRVLHYTITCKGRVLAFFEALERWQSDKAFRGYLTQVLACAEFSAYRWETPALTLSNAGQPFQFVLLNSPAFAARKTDRISFADYFTDDDSDQGIVSFINLGGDATLVIPSPRADAAAYGHLAAFVRQAPAAQTDAFWRIVGETVKSRMGRSPLWLSTAGGGVAWLHARIDSRPKYYGYEPFKGLGD